MRLAGIMATQYSSDTRNLRIPKKKEKKTQYVNQTMTRRVQFKVISFVHLRLKAKKKKYFETQQISSIKD